MSLIIDEKVEKYIDLCLFASDDNIPTLSVLTDMTKAKNPNVTFTLAFFTALNLKKIQKGLALLQEILRDDEVSQPEKEYVRHDAAFVRPKIMAYRDISPERYLTVFGNYDTSTENFPCCDIHYLFLSKNVFTMLMNIHDDLHEHHTRTDPRICSASVSENNKLNIFTQYDDDENNMFPVIKHTYNMNIMLKFSKYYNV